MISRRSLLLGASAMLMSRKAATKEPVRAVLCGDSLAYQLGPVLRAVANAHGVRIAVAARGGSSVKQWLNKKWMERALVENPKADTVLISLGVNCTHVERSRLRADIERLLSIVGDLKYARRDGDHPYSPTPVWLPPPPLGMDTTYLHDAVLATGVACIYAPDDAPLEVDGIHLRLRGYYMWSQRIADVLWS